MTTAQISEPPRVAAVAAPSGPAIPRRRRFLQSVATHATLIVLSVVFGVPFFWMVASSFKTVEDLNSFPAVWFPETLILANYDAGLDVFPFARYLFNTLIVCVLSMIGAVLSSSFVAYGLARIKWRWRTPVFVVIMATLLIPFYITMVPLFQMFRGLNLTDTYVPLILPHFFGVPIFIFLLRQFFMGIPEELSESARLEGANELKIYWQIIMPLCKPALAAVALFQFLTSWNDLLGPLIYISDPDKYTLSLGLTMFRGEYATAFGPLMAASTVVVIPIIIVFFFAQRTFIQGITLTGIKG